MTYPREPKDKWRFPGTEENRTEQEIRKERADREATKQAVASAQMYRAMFPQLWDEK